MFGGSLVLVRRSLPRKHIWSWTLQGNPAAGVAMTLYGLMSPRRKEQIRAALDDWKAMPGRRGGYKWAA